MKEGFQDQHYASDDEVKTAVMKWLKKHSTKFYLAGIHAIERNGDYVEK